MARQFSQSRSGPASSSARSCIESVGTQRGHRPHRSDASSGSAQSETYRGAIHLNIADARALAFDERSFDVVFSSNMFGLLPRGDIALVLGEMFRVLRPGGRLVVVTMSCPEARMLSWMYQLGVVRLGRWRDVQLEPFVAATGFEDIERQVIHQLGVPSEILVARKPLGIGDLATLTAP